MPSATSFSCDEGLWSIGTGHASIASSKRDDDCCARSFCCPSSCSQTSSPPATRVTTPVWTIPLVSSFLFESPLLDDALPILLVAVLVSIVVVVVIVLVPIVETTIFFVFFFFFFFFFSLSTEPMTMRDDVSLSLSLDKT